MTSHIVPAPDQATHDRRNTGQFSDQSTTQSTDRITGQITGIYETHLPVADLARARAFYQGILGLPLAHALPQRRVEF